MSPGRIVLQAGSKIKGAGALGRMVQDTFNYVPVYNNFSSEAIDWSISP